ncbi:MAG: hypothetical protein ABI035_10040 [Gemmatimonadaceae bacterium]
MGDNGKNGKAHKDPHRDLHAASGGAQTDRPKSRSDTPMNASGVTPGGKEPSMGGSQGTRAEARNETNGDKHRNSASDSSQSASNREGGYGADSGYSDQADTPRDHARTGKSTKRRDANSEKPGSE